MTGHRSACGDRLHQFRGPHCVRWSFPYLGLTLVADLSQVAGSVGELGHELVEYPVERTHGDGGRRARELWTCVWLVDIGYGGQAPQATPRPSVVHPG